MIAFVKGPDGKYKTIYSANSKIGEFNPAKPNGGSHYRPLRNGPADLAGAAERRVYPDSATESGRAPEAVAWAAARPGRDPDAVTAAANPQTPGRHNPLRTFDENDVVPTLKDAAAAVSDAKDDILRTVAPAARDISGKRAADVLPIIERTPCSSHAQRVGARLANRSLSGRRGRTGYRPVSASA